MNLRNQVVVLLFAIGLLIPEGASGNNACDAFMYRNEDMQNPTTLFSPHDRIVVRVRFNNLEKGNYTFQADWYNPAGEFQDTSSSYFKIEKTTDVVSESQLELMQAGTLRRLFSTSEAKGYHIKFYGMWEVKLFLNGEKRIVQRFMIH